MPIHKITDDFFFIQRGYLNGNHLVYKGQQVALFDTAYTSGIEDTIKILQELAIDIQKISLIINTHSHSDHVGANHYIQSQAQCEIALHKIGQYFINRKEIFFLGWKFDRPQTEFFQVTRGLEDGEIIPTGPYRWRVIHTPGHAFDGIVLYEPFQKWLISGDALWEADVASLNLYKQGGSALFQMYDSIERLASLEVKVVFPGHGKMFSNYDEAIAKSRQKIQAYFDNPSQIGHDFIKKVMIFSLMMLDGVEEKEFYPMLLKREWFKHTVDLYFNGEYETQYQTIVNKFIQRGLVIRKDGKLMTIINKG
jgi:glyoxylase-like metal-dependent hydrolase (beta-lactamase superfamily II)